MVFLTSAAQDFLTPPFEATFNVTDKLTKYTVIDANNDGKTWGYYSNTAKINENSSLDMDDWLISPAVDLEAGKTYGFTISAYTAGYPEKIEVAAGTVPTVEGMTISIIEPTEIPKTSKKTSPTTLEGKFTASSTGRYHIGIHGCSDKDNYILYVSKWSISAPEAGATVPAAVSDLKVTPDASGALEAVVSFTAPLKDAEGGDVTSIEKIVIRRGETVDKELTDVAPGQTYEIPVKVEAAGSYTWEAVTVINGSEGTPMSATAYVGVAKPMSPADATIVETETDGTVTVSWSAPAKNEYGHAMSPDIVTYTITATGETPRVIASGITGTSHTFKAVDDGIQTFLEFEVSAQTEAGSSAAVKTPIIAAGKPYTLPHELRINPQGYPTVNFRIEGDWSVAVLSTDIDEDGHVLRFSPDGTSAKGLLATGKVAIPADARNPIFTFFYYTWDDSDAQPTYVYPIINGIRVSGVALCTSQSSGWKSYTLALDEYKGKCVEAGFEIEPKPMATGLWRTPVFDGISISDPYAHDLMLKSADVPQAMKTDGNYTLTAAVKNIGASVAETFSMELWRNGEMVDSKECGALEPGMSATVTFTQTPAVNWPSDVTYQIKAVYDMDENTADNSLSDLTSHIILPSHPVPAITGATDGGTGVKLMWTAPALSTEPSTVTEGFEDYVPFAINDAGEWAFIDADGSRTYSFNGEYYPGMFEPMAYTVFPSAAFSTPETFAAHGGEHFLGTLSAQNGANDDWLISPLLPGAAQTVSLYAKSYNDKYGLETFEILYTDHSGDLTPDDFTMIKKVVAPTTWSKSTANLPEGTTHFAIRCTSDDKYCFMLDDITFTIAAQTDRYDLSGYNVYRNGEKLNDAPVEETCFIDSDAVAGVNYNYQVSAVYANRGESCLSAPFMTGVSGIEDVAGDDCGNLPEYYNLQGVRVIQPSAGQTYIVRRGSNVTKEFLK